MKKPIFWEPPIVTSSGKKRYKCSNCKLSADVKTPFCPYCGKAMTVGLSL